MLPETVRCGSSAVRCARPRAAPESRCAIRRPSLTRSAFAARGSRRSARPVGKGGTSSVEADLEPGAYELFCPVGSHEQAGTTARLLVR
jgi:hypothetical protein